MPSVFSHAVAGAAIGVAHPRGSVPRHAWAMGALCAVLCDLDVIAFQLGIPYGHVLGHRGFFHGIVFAALIGACAAFAAVLMRKRQFSALALFSLAFLAAASHGILDAATDGGLGVAFFSPFSEERHFLPFRPISASPLSLRRFFTANGFRVISNELRWVWLPSILIICTTVSVRRWRDRPPARRAPGGTAQQS